MSGSTDTTINCCDCRQTPSDRPRRDNRPGLSSLSYRIGTYATIFRRMLSRISTVIPPDEDHNPTRPLAVLTTRDKDDPAVALLDASAVVADVLTFYQERIVNEGFIRTATERRSIFELARTVGYELNPGVAASAYLAFTVEDAVGAPGIAEIPAGTKVQSVPPQNGQPQTFETSTSITAYAEYNAIRPRLTYPQVISEIAKTLYVKGTATNLKIGDRLLISPTDSPEAPGLARVIYVKLQPEQKYTKVDIEVLQKPTDYPTKIPKLYLGQKDISEKMLTQEGKIEDQIHDRIDSRKPLDSPDFVEQNSVKTKVQADFGRKFQLNKETINTHILNKKLTHSVMNAFLTFNKWDRKELSISLLKNREQNPTTTGSVYALRTIAGIFGNNAPAYKSLPQGGPMNITYGKDWDTDPGLDIWTDQQELPLEQKGTPDNVFYYSVKKQYDIFLDRFVPGIVPGLKSWVWLEGTHKIKSFKLSDKSKNGRTDQEATDDTCLEIIERVASGFAPTDSFNHFPRGLARDCFVIMAVGERSLAGFAMSGRVTGLVLGKPDTKRIDDTYKKQNDFLVRDTSVYLQSEKLDLVECPLETDVPSGDPTLLELDGLFPGLHIGQPIALSGEVADDPGVVESEILTIKGITHNAGFTQLTFESGLLYSYKRDTVTINANVVPATHGESLTELLGNGDGAQPNQRFTLSKPPLTYIHAPTPGGSAGTLRLRVNDILWDEAPSLYDLGPNDETYIVRIDDDGKASIIFGDGKNGLRLPTGTNNIVASYRSGIGLAGEVGPGSLTTIQSRPLGVRDVTNPLAAGGAGDPEKTDSARINAPLVVRTLDRIVSLDDYEDFARGFAGIGKARAVDLWNNGSHFIHITIAGENGKPITDTDFLENFMNALDAMRDPMQQVIMGEFELRLFNLSANIGVDRRYITGNVFKAVDESLTEAFSFGNRGFGQAVTAAEVITVIQKVMGIIYIDLDSLHLSCEDPTLNQILPANIAYVADGSIMPARLLLINPFGIELKEAKT